MTVPASATIHQWKRQPSKVVIAPPPGVCKHSQESLQATHPRPSMLGTAAGAGSHLVLRLTSL